LLVLLKAAGVFSEQDDEMASFTFALNLVERVERDASSWYENRLAGSCEEDSCFVQRTGVKLVVVEVGNEAWTTVEA
jgi:hypothetical protein